MFSFPILETPGNLNLTILPNTTKIWKNKKNKKNKKKNWKKFETTAVKTGNGTRFLTENITQDRKRFITQSKHMVFW